MPIHNITKTLSLILLAIFFLTACSKKNTPAPTNTKVSIIGKWYNTKDTTTYYDYPLHNLDMQYTYQYDHTGYLQFNSDSTGIEGSVDTNNNIQTSIFTYKVTSDDQLTFNFLPQTVNGTMQVAFSYTYAIKTLNKNNLVLYYDSEGLHPSNARYVIETQYLSR